jgi:DNA-binding transcriptional regulator GbsR (MarR family)
MMTPLVQRFVLHCGEMGSRWGFNRTVGQIYALLFVAAEPLNADEIGQALGFSRSNVSMGLKELQSWRLVRLQHRPGDRREYFSAPDDVWRIFRTLVEERVRREVDPTLSMLRDALVESPANEAERHAQQRMREMHDLVDLTTRWSADVQKLETGTLQQLMQLGMQVGRLLEFRDRLRWRGGGTTVRVGDPPATDDVLPDPRDDEPSSGAATTGSDRHG